MFAFLPPECVLKNIALTVSQATTAQGGPRRLQLRIKYTLSSV